MWSWSSIRPPPKRASIVPHKSRLPGEGFCDVMVVDQPRFAHLRGDHREGSRLPKCCRIDELRVLGTHQRLGVQTAHQRALETGLVTLPRGESRGRVAES